MKRIFTIKNKLKLQKLFTSILLKAIEEKKKDLESENYNFHFCIAEEVKRVKKSITPSSCMDYLQGCTLNIPIATYNIKRLIYKHLDINKNTEFLYSDNDEETIDKEYWNLMGITLCRITQEKIKKDRQNAYKILRKVEKGKIIAHAFNFMEGKYIVVYRYYNKYKVVGTGLKTEIWNDLDIAISHFNSVVKNLNVNVKVEVEV